MISIINLFIYSNRNDKIFVNFSENSNIDYKVFLRENNYFDKEYLESNKQYIASLIDYINASFDYKLSFEDKPIEYKYSYRIESVVNVTDNDTDKVFYTKKQVLLEEKEFVTIEKNINIKENININYNEYNELISNFVNTYELGESTSILNINMYVKIVGLLDENNNNDNNSKESIISLSIPLTTKTIAIDLSDNLVNSSDNILRCKVPDDNYIIFFVVGIILLFVDFILVVTLIIYINKTRSYKNIYEKKVKKILNNYGAYIQSLDNDLSFEGYQLLEIKSFDDMLEIRETIRQPILMRENKDKTGILFMIPNNAKILYVYRLRVVDIENSNFNN